MGMYGLVRRVWFSHAGLLAFSCLLLHCCSSGSSQHVNQPYQISQQSAAGWGQRQHSSRRLAAERICRRRLQDAAPTAAAGTAASSKQLPVPLTAAGVPARVFTVDFPNNKASKQHAIQELGSKQPTNQSTDGTFVSGQRAPYAPGKHKGSSDGSAADSNSEPVSSATEPGNQWYNNQVSGVAYFGRIPATGSNQSLAGLYPLGADAQAASTPNGCSEYAYPRVVQYPTVFFTVALQDFSSSENLGQAEEVAYSAAVNSFLAPTMGDIVSNTTFLHQEHVGTTLCLPSATALLEGGDVLRDFFQATLDKDPNMVFPTAAWGTIRTSNIIYRAPEKQSELTFNWFASDYGNCSALCGGGEQSRQVACMDSRNNPAAESSCPQPPPATTRPCQTQPCDVSLPTDFSMVFGDWSACNSTCGTGSRIRSATCVSREGYVGSLASCSTSLEAVANETWQLCTLPACPTHIWSYSDWICDNPSGCGGRTATRNVSCIQAETKQTVNESLCDPAQLDNSTQPCAQALCEVFFWKARELADCMPDDPLKPCGRYVQRRRFDCVNMTSNEVVPFISCTGPKPELGDVECQPTITCVPGPTGDYVPASSVATGDQVPAAVNPGSAVDTQTVDSSVTGQQTANTSPGQQDDSASVGGDAGMPIDASTSSGAVDAGAGSGETSSKPASPEDTEFHASEGGWDENTGSASDSNSNTTTNAASPAPGNTPLGQPGLNGTSNSNGSTPSVDGNSSNSTDANSTNDIAADGSNSTGTDNTSTGTNTASVTVPLQPVNGDPVQQLGPGQTVPGWLFDNPTPNLQELLKCPSGQAVNPFGVCCNGPNLDLKGNCCDGIVDACGVCNGTGKALDSLGVCCSTTLDARGVCCDGFIDECGACNGQNACMLRAELQATLPTAAIYLMPQSKIKQGLIDALQSRMLTAVDAASGRDFDKSRLTITLSAYKPPVIAAAGTVVGPAKANTGSWSSTPAAAGEYPQQSDADPDKYSSSSTLLGGPDGLPGSNRPAAAPSPATNAAAAAAQPVVASVSRPDGTLSTVRGDIIADEHTVQQPMQPDTVQVGSVQHSGQQGTVPSSLVQSSTPTWFPVESAANVAQILSTSVKGLRLLLGFDSNEDSLVIPSHSSTITPPEASLSAANSSNTIVITAALASGPQATGLDSGTFMMALRHMLDDPMPVPNTGDTLVVNFIKSADRPAICGDGICQAGERQAVDNSKSCPEDCGLPFLPCPPFDASTPTCNSRGVCYHSVGSCSCSTGYAGEDCSMCATNFKLVNGFCVAAAHIAPPRANSVVCVDGVCDKANTIFSSTTEWANFKKQGYSSVGGIIAIAVAGGASVLMVLAGALLVWKRRQVYLIEKCREKLATEAQTAQE